MKLDLDLSAIAPRALDVLGALLDFAAKSYAVWALFSLYVAPALLGRAYVVDLTVAMAALALVAVWRGVSAPVGGSAAASIRSAVVYAGIGLTAAWWRGEGPRVPTSVPLVQDEVSELPF